VRLVRQAAVGLLALVLAGCAETFDATSVGVPVTMSSSAGQPPQGERFSVTSHAVYGLWGMFRIKQPSLQRALSAQLGGGKAIADVKIHSRSRFFDVLITGLTLGIIAPRSVTYEGVVTK
jgi:hypothetical protein